MPPDYLSPLRKFIFAKKRLYSCAPTASAANTTSAIVKASRQPSAAAWSIDQYYLSDGALVISCRVDGDAAIFRFTLSGTLHDIISRQVAPATVTRPPEQPRQDANDTMRDNMSPAQGATTPPRRALAKIPAVSGPLLPITSLTIESAELL